ncbi:family 16 glycosylhydrolase [Dankookia sp. P2]|uniref:family 16 glycosylhydrolase n=1 Tax=Dankookia sp. P2 TaxID=3423955 RepID=UPI003D678FF6
MTSGRGRRWTWRSSSTAGPTARCNYNGGGNDVYGSIFYNGLDESKVHTYTLDWQPGKVTFLVDGQSYGGFSDNVSRDFDHGGINEVFSIMNRGGGTSITVYDISYSPSGGGGGGAVQAEVTTGGARQQRRGRARHRRRCPGQRLARLQPVRGPARLDVARRDALVGLRLIRTG